MTVQEFYGLVNGDYENVMSRLATEERVTKYLHKFTQTTDYDDLKEAMKNAEWEKAFLAVHSLKGMALNLGLSPLAEVASWLTEELRGGLKSESAALSYYAKLNEEYSRVIFAIGEL